MDILLEPKNKSTQEFLIYRKILDGRQGSKVQNRPNFTPVTPQITFWLGIWISFIRFGQNLAWTYYLTQAISFWENVWFCPKSKMAIGGQRSKIGKIWPQKSHFGSALVPVHQIWTKFCMDIQLDPSNKPAQEFLIYPKIQDSRRGLKVQHRPNLTLQITFWFSIWISFIRFGQKLT